MFTTLTLFLALGCFFASGVIIDSRSYDELVSPAATSAMRAVYRLKYNSTTKFIPSQLKCGYVTESNCASQKRSINWKQKCIKKWKCHETPSKYELKTTVTREIVPGSKQTLDSLTSRLSASNRKAIAAAGRALAADAYEIVWRVCSPQPKSVLIHLINFYLHSRSVDKPPRCINEWVDIKENVADIGDDQTKRCGNLGDVVYRGNHRCFWIVYKTSSSARGRGFQGHYALSPPKDKDGRNNKPEPDPDLEKALDGIYSRHVDPCCYWRNEKVYNSLDELGLFDFRILRRAKRKARAKGNRVCRCPRRPKKSHCPHDGDEGSGSGSGKLFDVIDVLEGM